MEQNLEDFQLQMNLNDLQIISEGIGTIALSRALPTFKKINDQIQLQLKEKEKQAEVVNIKAAS